jgi:hypothetical protein
MALYSWQDLCLFLDFISKGTPDTPDLFILLIYLSILYYLNSILFNNDSVKRLVKLLIRLRKGKRENIFIYLGIDGDFRERIVIQINSSPLKEIYFVEAKQSNQFISILLFLADRYSSFPSEQLSSAVTETIANGVNARLCMRI